MVVGVKKGRVQKKFLGVQETDDIKAFVNHLMDI